MTPAGSMPTTFLPMQSRPTPLCLQCLRELSMRVARCHRLRCKTRVIAGVVVDGEQLPEGQWASAVSVESGDEVPR